MRNQRPGGCPSERRRAAREPQSDPAGSAAVCGWGGGNHLDPLGESWRALGESRSWLGESRSIGAAAGGAGGSSRIWCGGGGPTWIRTRDRLLMRELL
jgi:hypothetical protein